MPHNHPILTVLARQAVIGDGGLGSELISRGLPAGDAPETWNVAHPDRVQEVHRAYIEAGSTLILTNTFGGNPIKLAAAGIAGRMTELNAAAVALLAAICPEGVFIGGDMGPTGEFLEPVGTRMEGEFVAAFREQAAVLAAAGVDLLILETMMDLPELEAAVKGVREACPLPVCASMTFEKDAAGDDFHTMTGVDIPRFVDACEALGVEIIGTNCGRGIHETVAVARRIRTLTDRFTLAFPNAGVPVVREGRTIYEQTPAVMQPYYRELIDMGINIIGGCCGTGPEHIRLVQQLLHMEQGRGGGGKGRR